MRGVIVILKNKVLQEKVFFYLFNIMVILMYFILLYYGLKMTGIDNFGDYWDEHIYLAKQPVLRNLFILFVSIVCAYFVGKLSVLMNKKYMRSIMLGMTCALISIGSILWVCGLHSVPVGDQKIVFDFASVLNEGEYYGFNKGQYLSVYPQQLGLITLLRVFVKVVGDSNYFAFQIMVALLVPLIPFAGCKIVRILTQNNPRVELYFELFVLTCFPIYGYTAFVYGDLISIPFVFLGAWIYLSCIKEFKVWKLFCVALCMGLAVMLKTNMYIVVIAMLIGLLVKIISGSVKKNVLIAIAISIGVLVPSLITKAIYSPHYVENADSMPASTWIAMGLSDNNLGPGWYSIYALDMFYRSDYNADSARKEAMKDIQDSISVFRTNPEFAVDFFSRKMNTQWNTPMYQSINMVNCQLENSQSKIIQDICYRGTIGKLIEKYMKVYQLLLYFSILLFMISRWKKENHIEDYVLLIAVFGGFLFTMMWEAKARYVFPYLVMMIPYMAMGVNYLAEIIDNRRKQLLRTKSE